MSNKRYYFNPNTGKFIRNTKWNVGNRFVRKYTHAKVEARLRELEDFSHNLNDQLKALADHVGLEVRK